MKKKWMCMLIGLLVMAIGLAGCGKWDSRKEKQEEANKKSDTTVEKPPAEPLKIAIVVGPSGIEDQGFNENIYKGAQTFLAKNPEASITPVIVESEKAEDAIAKVNEIVKEYNVFICSGYQFQNIGEIAITNKDAKFILVDVNAMSKDGVVTSYDNVYAMKFAEQESGFCVGMAAALETKTAKVAIVSAKGYPSNVNYQRGFAAGVDYVNKHYDTKVEIIEQVEYAGKDEQNNNIGGNYVGSFSDMEKGKEIADKLISKDVDIIFAAAGGSGIGVFNAIKATVDKPEIKVIGADMDQYDSGLLGDRNIVLTSALKVIDTNITKQLNDIKDGTFVGENALLRADTYATGYVKERGRHQLKDETILKIEEVFTKIKDGVIEIPSK